MRVAVIKKAISHFESAASSFQSSGDNYKEAAVRLKIAHTNIYMQADPEFKDVMDEYILSALDVSRKSFVSRDVIVNNEQDEQRAYALQILYKTLHSKAISYPALQYSICIALGDYFAFKKEHELAKLYYQTSIVVLTLQSAELDFPSVITALRKLAWVASNAGDMDKMHFYIDKANEISKKEGNALCTLWTNTLKGRFLSYSKQSTEAITSIKQVLDSFQTLGYSQGNYERLKAFAYPDLHRAYSNLNQQDSANLYWYKARVVGGNILTELNEVTKMEAGYTEEKLNIRLQTLAGNISLLQGSVARLLFQKDSLIQQRQLLRGEISGLELERVRIGRMNDSIRHYNAALEQNKIADEKHINSLSRWVKIASIGILVLALSGFTTVHQKNKKVIRVRRDLQALAKAKTHNVQNNYSSIYNLLLAKDFEKAEKYADASSEYFGLLVDTEDMHVEQWTIAEEWKVLHAFLEREKLLNKDIRLVDDFGNLPTDRIRFLPEIFTTLLHNSCKHGFKNRMDQLIFKVVAQKKGGMLHITVSDNGTPSSYSYIRADRPNKGLAILERRINNEFKFGLRMYMRRGRFKIDPIPDVGTIITFKFPYHEAIKNSSS